jgi:two-component system, NtrC family, response regulator AtoC
VQFLTNAEILVVEDETLLRRRLCTFFEDREASVSAAANLAEARRLLAELPYDFVLLDVNLPDGSGLDLLRNAAFSANTAVVVMTAANGVETAVEAMKLGAADFLAKPFEVAELPIILARARQHSQARRREEFRREQEKPASDRFLFSTGLQELKGHLEKIVAADRRLGGSHPPVLIEGETGTGKSSIARWLHYHGPRKEGPLVEVNCSALPESLAESELFGHERGAFTDARKERIGLFEAADGGTLFLDEIASLSLPLQAKVLIAIEDGKIRRLGGNKMIAVEARVVAASNRDLREAVREGAFREDLYHRLDLYRLRLPALRERPGDLPELAEHLLGQIARRHRLAGKKLSNDAIRRLQAYAWPGNVRELDHVLERAVVFEEGDRLQLEALGGAGSPRPTDDDGDRKSDWFNASYVFPACGFALDRAIDRLIEHALRQTGHNVSAAARLLSVPRDYLRYRLKRNKRPVGNGSREEVAENGK